MEAETEAQYAEYWQRYEKDDAGSGATKAFWARFNDTIDRSVSTERWTLRK